MYVEAAREHLMFDQVSVQLTDEGRHWQFYLCDNHIGSYWPGSAKIQFGNEKPRKCISAVKATQLVEQRVQGVVTDPVP